MNKTNEIIEKLKYYLTPEEFENTKNEIYEELVSALQILGYTTKEIQKIEGKIEKDLNIEEALKKALKIMS